MSQKFGKKFRKTLKETTVIHIPYDAQKRLKFQKCSKKIKMQIFEEIFKATCVAILSKVLQKY